MSDLRRSTFELSPEEFKQIGYELIDRIAELFSSMDSRMVTPGETPKAVRSVLGDRSLPIEGGEPKEIMIKAADLLINHSLFNGHPRFWGYITSSATPIGVLGDLLASAINPNVGGSSLSPMASEIEAQCIRWIAEFIRYKTNCGGILVSGGNMANFVGFLAARTQAANWNLRQEGISGSDKKMFVYASKATHTWIEKAADQYGLGTNSIRWIEVDSNQEMQTNLLELQIKEDIKDGYIPMMVIGTAGSVGTGSIDPLKEIAEICKRNKVWFHIDGAYGAPAAGLEIPNPKFSAFPDADSIALDPHKWFYAPMEAGCALVKNPTHLLEAFSFRPEYYHFDDDAEASPNYYEYGPQNSRGFRALKVWLAFQQQGKKGYQQLIGDDIKLAKKLHDLVEETVQLEAFTHNLSITTFRFIPKNFDKTAASSEEYLNELNTALLDRLQNGGEVFVSNAVLDGKYVLRACIVNFRTTLSDIEALPQIIIEEGNKLHNELQKEN